MELDAGRREAQMALAGFGLMIAISLLCGYRMTIPYGYYQLLGADHLSERLLESILYLHAQPPLLNLGLGIAQKASRLLGVSPETLLLAGHIALGAIGIWGFARLAQRLVANPWIRRVCIGFVVLHPALYMALFHYFYTFHELVLLCLIPLYTMASVESKRVAPYALLCGLTVALVYTHSLFHWGTATALLGAVAWLRRRAVPTASPAGRGHLVCFGVALTLLLAWPAKNWVLLGEFSYTTWGGYSLALELPIPRERVPAREWRVPEKYRHIPVLAERLKIDGSKNWNHHSMIGHADELGSLALRTLGATTAYAAAPWQSPVVTALTQLAPLELLTAWTPAHSEPATMTVRFAVSPPGDETPEPETWIATDDTHAHRRLQSALESGRRFEIIGPPAPGGVPLREVTSP